MKKKLFYFLAASMMVTAMTGCSDDTYGLEGEGRVNLSASVKTDVKVVSRAMTAEELKASCDIWISKAGGGLVRRYVGVDNLPAEGITLLSGNYVAEVWAGDSIPASFDARFYKGIENFEVAPGASTNVNITCRVANTLVSVNYDADMQYLLKDVTMTVSHTRGTLIFEGYDDDRVGSFMMPNGVTDLTYKLQGTKMDGSKFEREGVIPAVKPATQYILTVKSTPDTSEIGGGFLTIVVDDTEIEVNDTIEITTAPDITGYEFSLAEPVIAAPGSFTRRSVWIRAVGELTKVTVTNPNLGSWLGIGTNEIDLVHILSDASVLAEIKAAGITPLYSVDANGNSMMKISFEESLLNSILAEGEYPIVITATDAQGRVSAKTLTLKVSAIPVIVTPVDPAAVGYDTAVLTGTILKDDATGVAFEYRDVTEGGDWIKVPAVAASSPAPSRASVMIQVTATVSGLVMGHTYEYRLVTDDFTGDPMQFTTPSIQLPNSGFEDWQTSSTPYLIYAAGDAMFWDSGNHGSATMSKNVTVPDGSVKHSGNYSIKLASQFVGVGAIGKFAAGNVFIGQYLGTDGTDGILGFGRPFTQKPKALKAWVKYKPVKVNYEGAKKVTTDEMDQGVIYVALLDGTTDSEYPDFPVVIKTKSSQLFDKNGSNVIAYGELALDETDGAGMVQVTVPLNYLRNDVNPSFILCTMSASKGGDYFRGGSGSNMWVDDVELVY